MWALKSAVDYFDMLFCLSVYVFTYISGLVEKVVVDYENKRLQKEQHEQIESLKIVQAAASDTESAMALFREIDADGSGQLDEEEFGNLVTCMGKCVVVVMFCVCVVKCSVVWVTCGVCCLFVW